MIAEPKNSSAAPASAWTAGIALLFLGIGLQGAFAPLVPLAAEGPPRLDLGDEVMAEPFESAAMLPEEAVELKPEPPVQALELPPLPEVADTLLTPEMPELVPLEAVIRKPEATPRNRPEPRPEVRPRPSSTTAGTGAPEMFTAGGGGKFPPPPYPATARASRLQGSLRLLVTVEPSGLPSSATVTSSSGHPILDSTARDHVQRRWRWPEGALRRYIVPVTFILQ